MHALGTLRNERVVMLVCAVDPGSVRCGYAAIRVVGHDLIYVDAGVIAAPASWSVCRRLVQLESDLVEWCDEINAKREPDEAVLCGVESGFVFGRQIGATVSSAARGVAIVTMAKAFGVEVREYAPKTVKKSVCGTGNAEKKHVATFVQKLLGLQRTPEPDAGDALGIAVTRARDLK